MADRDWGDTRGPNYALWDQVVYVVARWFCQLYAQNAGYSDHEHIDNPAVNNDPCDLCYNEARELVNEGFLKLLEVYGSAAYALGGDGVPEREAARRALQEMVKRADQIERVKQLLAQVAGEVWWLSPLEYDERGLPEDGDSAGEGLW